jgi:hypothetical protein
MKYVEPKKMSRHDIEAGLLSGDIERIAESLVSMANCDDDWMYSEDWCLRFLESTDPDIARIAAVCIADTERRHHMLNYEIVVTAIAKRQQRDTNNEELMVRLDITLEDLSNRYPPAMGFIRNL